MYALSAARSNRYGGVPTPVPSRLPLALPSRRSRTCAQGAGAGPVEPLLPETRWAVAKQFAPRRGLSTPTSPARQRMGRATSGAVRLQLQRRDPAQEVLLKYDRRERAEWLGPARTGRIRSAFTMKSRRCAYDATTWKETRVDGEEVVISGRKWWSTGVGHRTARSWCSGATDPRRRQPPRWCS